MIVLLFASILLRLASTSGPSALFNIVLLGLVIDVLQTREA